MTDFDRRTIEEFRATGGRPGGMLAGTPLVLIHHIGARSAAEHVTPLAYSTQGATASRSPPPTEDRPSTRPGTTTSRPTPRSPSSSAPSDSAPTAEEQLGPARAGPLVQARRRVPRSGRVRHQNRPLDPALPPPPGPARKPKINPMIIPNGPCPPRHPRMSLRRGDRPACHPGHPRVSLRRGDRHACQPRPARWHSSAVTRSLASATGTSPSHIRADDRTDTRLPGMRAPSRSRRAPSGSRRTPKPASALPSGTSEGVRAGSPGPGQSQRRARGRGEPARHNQRGHLGRDQAGVNRAQRPGPLVSARARARSADRGTRPRSAGGRRSRSARS